MAKDVQIIPANTDLRQKAVNSKAGIDVNPGPETLAELDRVILSSSGPTIPTPDRRRRTLPFHGADKRRNQAGS
jgi:hypothetical protein